MPLSPVPGRFFRFSAIARGCFFTLVYLGWPDRAWHMVPFLGHFNWQGSLLTWDVIVLNGYLAINLYVCIYVLYTTFHGRRPKPILYVPVVFLAIAWAPTIHTITAFLFQGLGGRPFWNTGLIAPRFLASAFAAGPAFKIVVFTILKRLGAISFESTVIDRVRVIVTISLLINIFLAGSELFAEFYSDSAHTIHISHLFGLHGASLLAPWIWASLIMNVIAALILLSPARHHPTALIIACVMIVVGIWIEKGLGFVVPGFIPSTLGDMVQYFPTLNEIVIRIGIWALGLLMDTLFLKGAIPIVNQPDIH